MTTPSILIKSRSKAFNKLFTLKKDAPFFVFDVETWGLSATPQAFALGCIYGKDYFFSTTDIEEMQRELLSPKFEGAILFAHNALYDMCTIFGNFIQTLDPRAVFNNSTFILARHGRITFADSYNILPAKAEIIGELSGKKKGKTPSKFLNATRERVTKKDIEYCKQDCLLIWDALNNMFQEIGCVRLTLASLSMAYFRRKYLKETLFYTEDVYEFFDSYYGGRVEAFNLGDTYAQKFDINSMYPYAMAMTKFPDIGKLKRKDKPSLDQVSYYMAYYEGLISCKVKHKKTYFGYLPYRYKDKLMFPVGTFNGCWNFNELKFAIQEGVVEIIDVDYVIYAPPMDTPFKGFVLDLYKRRKDSKNEFERYYLKLILNSLYGKFAQRRKFNSEYFKTIDSNTLKRLQGEFQIVPFNAEREDGYIVKEELTYSYNTIPVFSSYITSFARVLLLKKMIQYAENEVVYVDTDSIALANDKIEVKTGNNLGDFKKEDKIITFIHGNKSYEEKGGHLVMKGVKLGSQKVGKNSFLTTKMIKPKSALRRKLQAGSFIQETKTISNEYNKREVLMDGTTKPIEI